MNQAQRALSTIGSGVAGSNVSRTLSERLEGAAHTINYQGNRIEEVLAKINGTPRTPRPADSAEKVSATAPLSQSVEMVEQLAARLTSLADNLEQVA